MSNISAFQPPQGSQQTQVSDAVNDEFAALLSKDRSQKTPDVIFDDATFAKIERIASVMASGNSTVPKHLQGNKADCFAIAMQAAQWGMNPFVVAQKTHCPNGTLGYESQLVNAVIIGSGVIVGRPEFTIGGDWNKAKTDSNADAWVEVSATIVGEKSPRKKRLNWRDVGVKNSPLWKSNPEQQACYLALKYWSRLYTPDLILGVYSPDELDDRPQAPIFPVSLDTAYDVVDKTIAAIEASTTLDELAVHRATAMTFKGAGKRRAGAAVNAKREELTAKTAPVEQSYSQEPEQPANEVDQETGEVIEEATVKESLTVQDPGPRDPIPPSQAVMDWRAHIATIETKSDISRTHTDIKNDARLTTEEKADLTDELRARQSVI
jgi:hypothetical protein